MLKSKQTDMLQILLIYHGVLLLRSLNYFSFDRTSLSEQQLFFVFVFLKKKEVFLITAVVCDIQVKHLKLKWEHDSDVILQMSTRWTP